METIMASKFFINAYSEKSDIDFKYVYDCSADGNLTAVYFKNGSSLSVHEFIFDVIQDLIPAPMSLLVSMTIVYGLLIVLGLVGNTVTCYVILRNSSMHTITNYYIFSMAVSDFLFIWLGNNLND
jgi:hypothetical protein